MKRRPAAAFVVTVSLLAAAGCKKESDTGGECKPPDCHVNPPPQPTPVFDASAIHANPPARLPDAGAGQVK